MDKSHSFKETGDRMALGFPVTTFSKNNRKSFQLLEEKPL
jgi:hypothetical protein